MRKMQINSVISWTYFFILFVNANSQKCPEKCQCNHRNVNFYVVCTGLEVYPTDMPANTTHLMLKCENLKNDRGQPILHTGVIHSIPSGTLQKLSLLKEFSILSCPIKKLPQQALAHLSRLAWVSLENILIDELEGDLFLNSYNLQRLEIEKCIDLIKIDPILLAGQTKLRRISISETKLSGKSIKNAIEHLSKTLRHFIWKMSKLPLTIPPMTFKAFKLVDLDLTNNNLKDIAFLAYTRAKKLYLAGNNNLYQPINFSAFKRLRHTKLIDLSNCNWNYLKGRQMRIFTNLKVLLIHNNYLTTISNDLLAALPKLRQLDVSNNLLTTLSSSLQNFTVFRKPANLSSNNLVTVLGNPYHCNCEMSWIFKDHETLADQILCSSGNPSQFIAGHKLNKLRSDLLKCSRPSSPIIKASNIDFEPVKPSMLPFGIQRAYYYILKRGHEVTFQCSSTGDPSPHLTWTLPNGATIDRQAPRERGPTAGTWSNTIDITIRQADLQRRGWENLTCTSDNPAGVEVSHLIIFNLRLPDNPSILLPPPPNNTAAFALPGRCPSVSTLIPLCLVVILSCILPRLLFRF